MSDLIIRNVVEEDFLVIAEVAEKCSPMTTERNSIYHIFTKFFKNTSLVVEDEDGSVRGFLLGFISQDNSENAYIHLLCLEKSLRGRKIAADLVNEFIKIVSSMGSKKISLITKPSNKTAIRFYNKIGFLSDKSDETVEIDGINVFKGYNGPGHDKIVFYKFI
jgi:ribosomal protein S18 acetylase RimI-like enzyme